jgi:hypothetical protein
MAAAKFFLSCYNFNPIRSKKVILEVSYKTIRSRSRNSDLRLRGAGAAKRNIFGSTTLQNIMQTGPFYRPRIIWSILGYFRVNFREL